MVKKEENSRQTPARSKLLDHLTSWLTVPETALYLSKFLCEEVSEAYVLRLALANRLKLSVYFVNCTYAKQGIAIPWEDLPLDPASRIAELCPITEDESAFMILARESAGRSINGNIMTEAERLIFAHEMKKLFGRDNFLHFYDQVIRIQDVWDLPMYGGERFAIEQKYHQLTDGPRVSPGSLVGVLVERKDGQLCKLQEEDKFATKELVEGNDENRLIECVKRLCLELDFCDAESLPSDAVLVVRTSALKEFEESYRNAQINTEPVVVNAPIFDGQTKKGNCKKGGRPQGPFMEAIEYAFKKLYDAGDRKNLLPGKRREFVADLKQELDKEIRNWNLPQYLSERIKEIKTKGGVLTITIQDHYQEKSKKGGKPKIPGPYTMSHVSKALTIIRDNLNLDLEDSYSKTLVSES